MKTSFCIAIILIAYLFVSNEDYKDQLAASQERNCIAQKVGERAVSNKTPKGTSCVRYDNVGKGMVPRLKFAEVWAR